MGDPLVVSGTAKARATVPASASAVSQGLPRLVCPLELLGASWSTKSEGGADPQDPGNQLIIHKHFIIFSSIHKTSNEGIVLVNRIEVKVHEDRQI